MPKSDRLADIFNPAKFTFGKTTAQRGRFSKGDVVRVHHKSTSRHAGQIGVVQTIEAPNFDSGMIEFRGGPRVHFYWWELQGVNEL